MNATPFSTARLAAVILSLLLILNTAFPAVFFPISLSHDGLLPRLLYGISHVSWLHCLLNVWCLLLLAFGYSVTLPQMLLAYAISVCVPRFCLSATPTVGLSAMLFAMMGYLTLHVRRKAYFALWVGSYIAVGFLLPSVNAPIHLYAYLAAIIIAILNHPIKR